MLTFAEVGITHPGFGSAKLWQFWLWWIGRRAVLRQIVKC